MHVFCSNIDRVAGGIEPTDASILNIEKRYTVDDMRMLASKPAAGVITLSSMRAVSAGSYLTKGKVALAFCIRYLASEYRVVSLRSSTRVRVAIDLIASDRQYSTASESTFQSAVCNMSLTMLSYLWVDPAGDADP